MVERYPSSGAQRPRDQTEIVALCGRTTDIETIKRALRQQIRFTSQADIIALEASVKAYYRDGHEGGRIRRPFKSAAQFDVAPEFQRQLDDDAQLTEAFHALTPGRQKAYLLHFAAQHAAQTVSVGAALLEV